jgi:GNAT superfamily N-acetyltransferase
MPVHIRKVETQADFKPFFEFPWKLYAGDPNWTPPLLSMRREQYDKQKNPAWEYLDGDFFTATRDGRIVGTIAAYINKRHNEFNHEEIGWFGAFEVEDDPEAATALLNTAGEWVKARGFNVMRGPQTFTTHEETGLLVDGFTRPILLMPYNKPYYEKLVLGAGLQPVMDTYSFHLSRAEVDANGLLARLERITKAIMKRNHVTIRPIDRKNLKGEFELFKELYNAAWEKNWSFTPMTPRELDAMVKSLGQFFDPDLAFFGYVDGEPVGFIMAIPDFNQVLQKVYAKPGTPEVVSLVKALYHWKLNPIIDWARVPLMGVKEAYRSKGVDAAMYYYVLEAMLNGGYQHSDSGWILSSNQNMVSIAKNFGSQIYKTYRYYEKAL